MNVIGIVAHKGEIMEGMSANGEWARQTIVVTTQGDKPSNVPVEFFGKRKVKDIQPINVGDMVQVFFTINGREHDGRWFATLDGGTVYLLRRQSSKDIDQITTIQEY